MQGSVQRLRTPLLSSLRVRLSLLIVLAAVPLLGILLITANDQRQVALSAAENNALRLAQVVAGHQNEVIDATKRMLILLSQLPQMQPGHEIDCNALTAQVLRLDGFQIYSGFGVSNTDGDLVCSGIPLDKPINVRDSLWFKHIKATEEFTIGDYQIGRLNNLPLVVLAYPIKDNTGKMTSVVSTGLNLNWINDNLNTTNLPTGTTFTVIDQHGIILFRYPGADEWVGKAHPRSELIQTVTRQQTGTSEGLGLDNTERLWGFTVLKGTTNPMYAIVGVPEVDALAETNRLTRQNLIGLIIALLATLLIVWFGSGWLVIFPLRILVEATRRFTAGNLQSPVRLPYDSGELNLLADAFNTMRETLEQRTQQQRQAENELRELNEQLETRVNERTAQAQQAVKLRDEFLSVAAHELKTPVTSLKGFSQLLLRQLNKKEVPTIERLQHALSTMDVQSTKLTRLISHLLDISRLEAGRLILEKERCDLSVLAGNVVDMVRNSNPSQTITLNAPVPIYAVVDSIRLEQVLVNLLDNAIKYSPQRGEINVDVLTTDGKARLVVTDHGIGIPADRRANIFDRFYQAHVEGYHGGMGLGLYVSREIADLHGGRLYAEFPDEGGTRFILELPLQ